MSDKAKAILIYTVTLIFVLICFFGYRAGYRLQSNFLIGKVGVLHIDTPLPLTSIFIDNVNIVTTQGDNQDVTRTLSPGKHTIIVSRQGDFPWTKTIIMPSSGHINLSPLYVSQNTSGFIVRNFDPQYWNIRNQIYANTLPTKEKPLISKDGRIQVWIENNTVITKNGDTLHTIVEPDTVIQNISFYKNRGDVLIFSTNNGVYVIETDTEGTQNFMPLYKGTSPHFIEPDPQYIYVLDGETLLQVVI